jgi:transcriptional regulator with XRE-family HTH domain
VKKSIYSEKAVRLRDLLIKARTNAGFTQQQLADKLGKPQSFVAKYEIGERRLDVIEFLEVCDHIGIKPIHILQEL